MVELREYVLNGYTLNGDGTTGNLVFSFNFNLYQVAVNQDANSPKEFSIEPLKSKKKFKLRAKTEQDAGEWAYAIEERIQTSRGHKE